MLIPFPIGSLSQRRLLRIRPPPYAPFNSCSGAQVGVGSRDQALQSRRGGSIIRIQHARRIQACTKPVKTHQPEPSCFGRVSKQAVLSCGKGTSGWIPACHCTMSSLTSRWPMTLVHWRLFISFFLFSQHNLALVSGALLHGYLIFSVSHPP